MARLTLCETTRTGTVYSSPCIAARGNALLAPIQAVIPTSGVARRFQRSTTLVCSDFDTCHGILHTTVAARLASDSYDSVTQGAVSGHYHFKHHLRGEMLSLAYWVPPKIYSIVLNHGPCHATTLR